MSFQVGYPRGDRFLSSVRLFSSDRLEVLRVLGNFYLGILGIPRYSYTVRFADFTFCWLVMTSPETLHCTPEIYHELVRAGNVGGGRGARDGAGRATHAVALLVCPLPRDAHPTPLLLVLGAHVCVCTYTARRHKYLQVEPLGRD